jgi:hypothetical protein
MSSSKPFKPKQTHEIKFLNNRGPQGAIKHFEDQLGDHGKTFLEET